MCVHVDVLMKKTCVHRSPGSKSPRYQQEQVGLIDDVVRKESSNSGIDRVDKTYESTGRSNRQITTQRYLCSLRGEAKRRGTSLC